MKFIDINKDASKQIIQVNNLGSPKALNNSDIKMKKNFNIHCSNMSMYSGRSSRRELSNLNELRNQRKNTKSIQKLNAYMSNISSQDPDF